MKKLNKSANGSDLDTSLLSNQVNQDREGSKENRERRLSEDIKNDNPYLEMEIEEQHQQIIKIRNNSKNKGEKVKEDPSRSSSLSVLPLNRRVGQWQLIDNWLWVNNQVEFQR